MLEKYGKAVFFYYLVYGTADLEIPDFRRKKKLKILIFFFFFKAEKKKPQSPPCVCYFVNLRGGGGHPNKSNASWQLISSFSEPMPLEQPRNKSADVFLLVVQLLKEIVIENC